jgi:hypothetical protein
VRPPASSRLSDAGFTAYAVVTFRDSTCDT